ncbi:MAG: response regulator transcription factor [Hyphomicrobiales bacterium]|nr:MAG: response regulator transcription factor [Hyphomicrobiales bacterium]
MPLRGTAERAAAPPTRISGQKIRVAFVDDHPTLLRGLVTIFTEDVRYSIVAEGATAAAAVEIVQSSAPDVVVMDLSMPGSVFDAINEITANHPGVKIVVFTAYANVDLALRALDAGAHAFVLKGRPADDLSDAIASVQRGELYVSPDFSSRLFAGYRNRTRSDGPKAVRLSAREKQLVEGLLDGQSNKEIARSLQLTEKTIKHYMTNLMNKLKVKSRLEVALAAKDLQRDSVDVSFDPE